MNELFDPKHQERRLLLKSLGPAIAGTGLLLTIFGIASFFSSFGTAEPPRHFWCAFVGLPLLGLGLTITNFAFFGTIMRYMAGEAAPVSKDVANYMVAGTKDSIRDVAAAIGEGLSTGTNGESGRSLRCQACHTENDPSAKYCDRCGTAILKTRHCDKCGEQNDPDARFCDNCGNSVA